MAKVKNGGVNELTSRTGGSTSIGSDVLVESCVGGGCGRVSIDCDGGDILTRLAIRKSRGCASHAAIVAFGTDEVVRVGEEGGETVLDTFVVF